MVKAEMLIQVCINGRPIWRKSKVLRPEMTHLLSDKEYDRVLDAGITELGSQIKSARANAKEKVAAK